MPKKLLVCAALLFLSACVTKPDVVVDAAWSPLDEAALAELSAQPVPVAPNTTAGIAPPPPTPFNAAGAPLLEVHVFDIGQADAMLVVGPAPDRKTLLIDLGEPTRNSQLPDDFTSSHEAVLERIRAITGGTHIDYFVLTHYHSDHAGRGLNGQQGWGTGIVKLLSDFSIDFSVGEFIHVGEDGAEFMAPPASRSSVFSTIQRRMPVWIDRGRVERSSAPQFGTSQIRLGDGVEVDILGFAGRAADGSSAFDRARAAGANYRRNPGDENDLSIALQITAGDFELWTGGDLNGSRNPEDQPFVIRDFGSIFTNIEHHLVAFWERSGRENDVEVYRANHHGSGFSTTSRLLDALDPELILYSTGADHRHPDGDVVARGGDTADQLATTAVVNGAAFTGARGSVVGEITLLVPAGGRSYTVNGRQRTAFSDAAEAAGDDGN